MATIRGENETLKNQLAKLKGKIKALENRPPDQNAQLLLTQINLKTKNSLQEKTRM
jgi:hypothetical protein